MSDLWDLLNAGDWACAHADGEALSRISRQLAGRVEGRLARVAGRVATLAEFDLRAATALWGRLGERLRGELGDTPYR